MFVGLVGENRARMKHAVAYTVDQTASSGLLWPDGGMRMTDSSQGDGWWLAPDGKWYPPLDPNVVTEPPARSKKRRVTFVLLVSIVVLVGAAVAAYFVNGQTVPGFGSETGHVSFELVDSTDENPATSIIVEMTRGPVETFASQSPLTPIQFEIGSSGQTQFTFTDAGKEFQPGSTCTLNHSGSESTELQVIVADDRVSVRNDGGVTLIRCARQNPVEEARVAAEEAEREAFLAEREAFCASQSVGGVPSFGCMPPSEPPPG